MDTTDISRIEPDFSDADLSEPHSSPFAHLLEEMALYGTRPGDDEHDHRSLPEAEHCELAIATAVDTLAGMFADTRLEDDTENLLWGFVNLFHHQINRVDRTLDRNEQDQRQLQRDQDGSEVKAVELERLTAQGQTLLEQRNTFEFLRETAAENFRSHVGSVWHPSAGSRAASAKLTSAYIDSRDFIEAERRRKTERLAPEGVRIGFSGGKDYQDHHLIWRILDTVLSKHPKMVLLHTASKTGADLFASKWAVARHVHQVPFKPEFVKFKNAAPFKRNDELLEVLPNGLVIFPGSGIQDNLADHARKLGIPVADYRSKH